MKETLLQRFIKEKVNSYVEPQRKGTPRGEPIGLSIVKYKATLLMMTNKKQQEIAKELGISYGLLRKWNTEQTFKATVEKYCSEFADFWVKHTKNKLAQYRKQFQKNLKKPTDEMGDSQMLNFLSDEFSDSDQYSPRLNEKIITKAFFEGTKNYFMSVTNVPLQVSAESIKKLGEMWKMRDSNITIIDFKRYDIKLAILFLMSSEGIQDRRK